MVTNLFLSDLELDEVEEQLLGTWLDLSSVLDTLGFAVAPHRVEEQLENRYCYPCEYCNLWTGPGYVCCKEGEVAVNG